MKKAKGTKLVALAMTVVLAGRLYAASFGACDTVYGKEENRVDCHYYEFEGDSHYEITYGNLTDIGSNSCGNVSVDGDVKVINPVNGIPAYEVMSGNVSLGYSCGIIPVDVPSDQWHMVEDKSKTVDGVKLNENIKNGALILQTSLTGEDWITEAVYTNIFDDVTDIVSDFYTTREIQQINGCYYRIIVAYKMERQIEDKKYWFVSLDNFEYKKCAEVYTFYLINSSENSVNATSPSASPRKELGTKINTGKDNGFSGNVEITRKDPHYGWDIGTFFVNGYTRETKDGDDIVFLKNVGDRVTLWFLLEQDITCLNGDDHLSINEDTNGYDQYFEIDRTNFKHGTLIIRYTDYEGVRHEPVIYTDFLAANARTGADTKVELFEEGDYEVALDYEIRDDSWIDSYTNYRIFFTFQIRNGNCMVYPFDTVTGSELADNAITENGFRLDMARSRYLTIDVTKTILRFEEDSYIEDVRFSRPAKDGDAYVEEGIYTFTVKNLYTDSEPTTKTIYVGNSPILKALASNRLSLQEINELLMAGAELNENGEIEMPSELESEGMTEMYIPDQVVESDKENMESTEQSSDSIVQKPQTMPEETETFAERTEYKEPDHSMQMMICGAVVCGIVIIVAIVLTVRIRKKQLLEKDSLKTDKGDKQI